MEKNILKAFSILILLSLPTSGQDTIMVCKDVQNVFTHTAGLPTGSQLTRLQGPPGKKGVQGLPGPSGLPGARGLPGNPGVGDYERISEMIEERISQLPLSDCSVGAAYGGKIPNSSFTASSQWNYNHGARLGRINTPSMPGVAGAWCSKHLTIGQWIQVDLGNTTTVVGVKTQGRPDYIGQWLTSFHVACGLTSASMTKITELFAGNIDQNNVVTQFFPVRECRYLRIYPQTWHEHICMRMDFIQLC